MKEINIALLGFGTVGSGTAEALNRNRELIESQLGCQVNLKTVLVRHPEKYAQLDILKGQGYFRLSGNSV